MTRTSTPAERASAGDPLDVAYAPVDTPLGFLIAAATPRGLVRLAYERDNGGRDRILERLAARLGPRVLEAPEHLDATRRQLEQYFAGTRTRFDLPIDWALVAVFARRILDATAAIPFGSTRTYAEVAGAAGHPRAHRAAGNALGANPLPIVVPCHRVLRTGGGLGGYTGGRQRKEELLRLEGVL